MRTLIFGQTPGMAEEYKNCNEFYLPIDGSEVIKTEFDIPKDCNLTVYLVGDWELGEYWPSVLSALRRQANMYVVKMFIASEVI